MRSTIIGIAAVAIVASAAIGQSITPAKFVSDAGASDKFEIDSAHLMEASKNPKIAHFAAKMMADHRKSTEMVVTAAKADGLAPKPAELTIKQRADITALKAVPAGKSKDDLYVKQQKAAHEDALALMEGYASSGTEKHLKAAAGKIAPVVKGHLAMLGTM